MKIIKDTSALIKFCKKIKDYEFVTIDLEFLRDKTYWSQLCLIQVGTEDFHSCIDPLDDNIDLSAFFKVLKDESIVKVFHASRQDIEILYKMTGFLPSPLFDTQVAAMVCGFGESVSYQNLVSQLTKNDIDKSMRFSDWSKRPLSDKQIDYALSDVIHLVDVYKSLCQILEESGRKNWLDEEMKHVMDEKIYQFEPQEAWQKIKHRTKDRAFLNVLREVCAWREMEAQRKDIVRRRIISDDCLLDIAASKPKNMDELSNVRGINNNILSGRYANSILEAVKTALARPKEEYPKIKKKKNLGNNVKSLIELLKLLLKIKSNEESVVPKIIANEEDIEAIANFDDENSKALKGWRYDIFGQYAIKLREGDLKISFNPETRKINID